MITEALKKVLGLFNLEYKYGQLLQRRNGLTRYHKHVLDKQEGNMHIHQQLQTNKPLLVGRIGATELSIVLNYMHYKNRGSIKWNDYLRDEIWRQSGIFPTTDKSLNNFSTAYLKAISQTDIMGVWKNEGEDVVIKKYCNAATLIPLESIEPYYFENPWSEYLSNKKVLVIHPFEQSIQQQYNTERDKLFSNKKVLPLFQLQTIKAVQAQVYNATSFNKWEDVYEHMKKEILKKDFDVAIIGSGGYGLLVGAFVKSLGKKAIHMGGATQILFGIRGKRWDDREEFRSLFNEHWKYPNPDERPEKATLLEGGAYW